MVEFDEMQVQLDTKLQVINRSTPPAVDERHTARSHNTAPALTGEALRLATENFGVDLLCPEIAVRESKTKPKGKVADNCVYKLPKEYISYEQPSDHWLDQQIECVLACVHRVLSHYVATVIPSIGHRYELEGEDELWLVGKPVAGLTEDNLEMIIDRLEKVRLPQHGAPTFSGVLRCEDIQAKHIAEEAAKKVERELDGDERRENSR